MTTPLPSPQSLLSALNTLERAVSDFERGREKAPPITAESSDHLVKVTVNGIGRVIGVFIDQSQLALLPTVLAPKVLAVANSAIDAAYAATKALIAGFARTGGMKPIVNCAFGLAVPAPAMTTLITRAARRPRMVARVFIRCSPGSTNEGPAPSSSVRAGRFERSSCFSSTGFLAATGASQGATVPRCLCAD